MEDVFFHNVVYTNKACKVCIRYTFQSSQLLSYNAKEVSVIQVKFKEKCRAQWLDIG